MKDLQWHTVNSLPILESITVNNLIFHKAIAVWHVFELVQLSQMSETRTRYESYQIIFPHPLIINTNYLEISILKCFLMNFSINPTSLYTDI